MENSAESKSVWPLALLFLVVVILVVAGYLFSPSLFDKGTTETIAVVAPLPVPAVSQEAPKQPEQAAPVASEKWSIGVPLPGVSIIVSGQVSERYHTVRTGDTLRSVFGAKASSVCVLNKLKDCNRIHPGQKLILPEDTYVVAKVKTSAPRAALSSVTKAHTAVSAPQKSRTVVAPARAGEFLWRNVGGAPLKTCGKDPEKVNEEAWKRLGLTDEEQSELRTLVKERRFEWRHLPTGTRFPAVTFCGKDSRSVVVRENVLAAWPENLAVASQSYVLSTGRKLEWVQNCGNWATDTPVEKPAEPQAAIEPDPEEEVILPVHAKEGDVIPCNLQAGAGVYQNRVYQGAWGYGEGICYLFKQGEWQHGPGFYAMAGGGESRMSSYHNKETGIGLQYGIQRNWIGDRGRATFELKGRLLRDHMWGKNDSGYFVDQKGWKAGLYGSYYERHGDDLIGVIGEYWKGFGQKVRSSWSGQPVQDRGSVAAYGVYEHQLGDSKDWRLRWIAGVQHTNWDKQNWFRLIPEFRYQEWLMFGPQISVPIGISKVNQPLSHGDLTTVGAFVRVELGTEIRKQDADSREAQLEFIPPEEAAKPPE